MILPLNNIVFTDVIFDKLIGLPLHNYGTKNQAIFKQFQKLNVHSFALVPTKYCLWSSSTFVAIDIQLFPKINDLVNLLITFCDVTAVNLTINY